MSLRQPPRLKDALQAMLWKRLLLPYLVAMVIVVGMAAYYGGRLVEDQQLKYSRSIGYTTTHFLVHAGKELDAISSVIPMNSLEYIEVTMAANRESHEIFETIYLLDKSRRIRTLVPFDPRYVGMDMSRRAYFTNLDCNAGVNFSPSAQI